MAAATATALVFFPTYSSVPSSSYLMRCAALRPRIAVFFWLVSLLQLAAAISAALYAASLDLFAFFWSD